MNSTKKTGIIGAGPSGLSLGLFLEDRVQILEKEERPGGHAASFETQGFTFDFGPHIMFSKNQAILEFMVSSLGTNVHRCRRNNKISFKNKLIKYPFENDLKSLPLEDNYECLKEFVFNPYKKTYSEPKNMREWLLKVFGRGICEKYLFPYNEKVWNIPVDRLSMLWSERIPNPPAEDILRSAIGLETEGYTHQLYYYYPKKGGYQAISESWARGQDIRYGFEVKTVEKTTDGKFLVSDGRTSLIYEQLVSTLPIQHLLRMIKFDIPSNVLNALDKLIVNPMYVVSLGIKGIDQDQYTAIYFPEPDFLVNRVSYPCTFSPDNAPSGHYSIQAEITCIRDSDVWRRSDAEILDHVKKGLFARGLIPQGSQIVLEDIKRKEFSYVVYDLNYQENVGLVRDWAFRQNIHLLGRFSYFEYVNVDMAVDRAAKLATHLNPSIRRRSVSELLMYGLNKLENLNQPKSSS